MARSKIIKIIRTTRANLDAQKTANNLLIGEPYLITDENRIAVGTAINAYQDFKRADESASGGGESVNIETLSANKTLIATDAPIQIYTCTANRIINLPTTGLTNGQKFEIWNNNAYDSAYYLDIKQSGTTIYQLTSTVYISLRWDGSIWQTEFGKNICIGYNSNSNYSYGMGIGYNTYSNYSNGVGVGYNSNNNYSNGVGIGYGTNHNYSNGVGIGYGTYNNYSYGIGIGSGAYFNYNYGIGIGYNTYNNYSYGIGIGCGATTQAKGVGAIAIGYYSQTERKNEYARNISSNSTRPNLALLSIPGWFKVNTADATPIEIFLDSSSSRYTLLAKDLCAFSILVNAVGITTAQTVYDKVKCWKIEGVIHRPSSGNIRIVGTPTYTVLATDTEMTACDLTVSADTANNALKLTATGIAASDIRWSAISITNETRY